MSLTHPSKLLHSVFHTGPLLQQLMLRAATWSFAGRLSIRLLNLVRTVILARLLTPSDFGAVATGLVVWLFLEAVTRPGLKPALVQKRGDIGAYLDTAWSINVGRGVILSGVLLASAPLIAWFFHADNVVPILRVMALAAFLPHLSNPGIVYFQKELQLHKQFQYDVSRTIVEVSVAVVLAVALRSVWAIVFGLLAGEVAALVISYVIHPYRPRLKIQWGQARELYRFGFWVHLDNVINAISNQADKGVIGTLLGPASLGLYYMATGFSYLMSGEIGRIVYGIAFPAYARIQDEKVRLRGAYLNNLEIVTSLAVPFAVAFLFLAHDLVMQVLGEKWLPAVPVIQVLVLASCFQVLDASAKALFHGIGRPGSSFCFNSLRIGILVVSVFPLVISFGVTGAAFAVLLSGIGTTPLQLMYTRSTLEIRWKQIFQALGPALALSGVLALVLLASRLWLASLNPVSLVVVVGLALCTYVGSAVALWRLFGSGPLSMLPRIRRPSATNSSLNRNASKGILKA